MPHDDLLVLDPQAQGKVPVRRLRGGARGHPTRRRALFLDRGRARYSCSDYFYYTALTVGGAV